MGYVPVASAAEGNQIFIRIRKNDIEAKVVKTPFYKK
jgi:aminomethyltransferase